MIITKHDLINIQELLVKQKNDMENAIRFSEDHPRLAKNVGDKLDEMKILLQLSDDALSKIGDILDELEENDEFLVIGKE